MSIGPLRTNFSESLINIQNFSFTKMHLKISSAKLQPFCPGEDELIGWGQRSNPSMGDGLGYLKQSFEHNKLMLCDTRSYGVFIDRKFGSNQFISKNVTQFLCIQQYIASSRHWNFNGLTLMTFHYAHGTRLIVFCYGWTVVDFNHILQYYGHSLSWGVRGSF